MKTWIDVDINSYLVDGEDPINDYTCAVIFGETYRWRAFSITIGIVYIKYPKSFTI